MSVYSCQSDWSGLAAVQKFVTTNWRAISPRFSFYRCASSPVVRLFFIPPLGISFHLGHLISRLCISSHSRARYVHARPHVYHATQLWSLVIHACDLMFCAGLEVTKLLTTWFEVIFAFSSVKSDGRSGCIVNYSRLVMCIHHGIRIQIHRI